MTRNRFRQADMAKRMKTSERTWRRWMSDTDNIPIGKLVCIANILNVTMQDLLQEGGEKDA